MRFLYVIEKAENNYSAYLPDIPGCIATGATVDEVKESLGKAVLLHLKGLEEDGIPIPQSLASADYLTVA
jgi:predicted RNase H-like HicB family nuclease